MSEHRIKVDNGKYEFILRDGWKLDIDRGGEQWIRSLTASKAIHSMMCELDAARVVVQAVRRHVEMPINGVPADVIAAMQLHDRLTSDREPPSAWCGVEQPADWIPPSQRVPEPGPCTPMAHNWVSGSAVCQCGEATRDGDCTGWKTASRLTGDQIYEAVTGQKKAAAHWPDCAVNHGGTECDMGPECGALPETK